MVAVVDSSLEGMLPVTLTRDWLVYADKPPRAVFKNLGSRDSLNARLGRAE